MIELLVFPEELSRKIRGLISGWETECQALINCYTHCGRME